MDSHLSTIEWNGNDPPHLSLHGPHPPNHSFIHLSPFLKEESKESRISFLLRHLSKVSFVSSILSVPFSFLWPFASSHLRPICFRVHYYTTNALSISSCPSPPVWSSLRCGVPPPFRRFFVHTLSSNDSCGCQSYTNEPFLLQRGIETFPTCLALLNIILFQRTSLPFPSFPNLCNIINESRLFGKSSHNT